MLDVDEVEDEETRLLVKWLGTGYADCTYEVVSDLDSLGLVSPCLVCPGLEIEPVFTFEHTIIFDVSMNSSEIADIQGFRTICNVSSEYSYMKSYCC